MLNASQLCSVVSAISASLPYVHFYTPCFCFLPSSSYSSVSLFFCCLSFPHFNVRSFISPLFLSGLAKVRLEYLNTAVLLSVIDTSRNTQTAPRQWEVRHIDSNQIYPTQPHAPIFPHTHCRPTQFWLRDVTIRSTPFYAHCAVRVNSARSSWSFRSRVLR